MHEDNNAISPEQAETPGDLQNELSELEYFASQRPLEAAESRRLTELNAKSGQIAGQAARDVERVVPGSPAVSGDDSPV